MTEAENVAELMLALDTSGEVCSIATLQADILIAEHTFRHGMHLSERLMSHVDSVLEEANATLVDVDTFAVGIGPGSFTGTRIGVMTLKTFAFLQGRPLYGVDSLEGIARNYAGLAETVVVPMLPCRAGMVYTGIYNVEGATPDTLIDPAALNFAELSEILVRLSPQSVLLCGPASLRYAAELSTTLRILERRVDFGQAMFPRASDLGLLAYRRRIGGYPADDAMELVPRYISPPPITMPKERVPKERVPKETGIST